ncbi:MAG TPA: nitronate monooxygenase [Candidatus Acidoferrales bacterium]|nr:nitronate monooxygenase [Candidatus Acidoferrales bacterium]
MLTTSFTRLVGCTAPIQLAGMPMIASPELAAAVSNAGGLGMVGGARLTPDALGQLLDSVAKLTARPFGVNFIMHFHHDPACVEVAAAKAKVVEFFYATPRADLVALAHQGRALVSWQVGSRDEAVAAEQAGCDFIVAQGIEAGGHVRGKIGLLPLLGEVLDAVKCPVLAAGGIGTPRALAAVLAAGAAGARLGTRFVAAAESGAHPRYVESLLSASAADTIHTEAFSVMWPDAPHRVLKSCIKAAEELDDEIAGHLTLFGQTIPLLRFAVPAPSRATTGHIEAMAMYAGESVGAVTKIQSASEIIEELIDGAEARLKSCSRS